MKPIYLRMTAFGSYCSTAEVDFTKLYDNGLFLITGKTGGGKTTILDAMCAALYGKATGSERAKDWRQMRCSHAAASVDTELEYVFSVDGTEYRFFRRWHLPNSKSGEPVLKDAEAACYRRSEGTEEWELFASGSGKAVSDAAERILRLTQTQFVKVIMLPQGEFRELLVASSDDKEAIFKKLFDTERWETITNRVTDAFRAVERECEEHSSRRELALRSAECDDAAQLREKIDAGKVILASLSRKAEENKTRAAGAAAALKAGEDAAALFGELAALQKEQGELSARGEYFASVEASLRRSRQLHGVLPQFRLLKAARSAVESRAVAQETAEKNSRAAEDAFRTARENSLRIPEIQKERDGIQNDIAALAGLAESRAAYTAAQRKLQESEQALSESKEALSKLNTKKTDTEARIAKGQEYLDQCHDAGRALSEATQALHAAEQRHSLTVEWEETRKKLGALEAQLIQDGKETARLTEELASRRAIASAVEQAIKNDKAYSLAAELTEGQPCPVCGATHHPHPAPPSRMTPSVGELERARADAEQCAGQLEELTKQAAARRAEYDLLSGTSEQLLAKAGGSFEATAEECLREKQAAQQRAACLKKLSDNVPKAQKKLQTLGDELLAIQHDIEKTQTDINNAALRIAAAQQEVTSVTQQLQAKGIDSFDGLDRRLRNLRSDGAALDAQIKALNEALSTAESRRSAAEATLTAAREHYAAAIAERDARLAEFRRKCADAGIDEKEDIEGGVLSEADEAARENELTNYREKRAFAGRRIAELSAQLDGQEPPRLEELRAANAAAIEEGQEIARQTGNAATRLQFLENTASAIAGEEAALAALQPRYDTAARMQRFLSGKNDMGIPIHQYVIGIKMDEVILSANLYLTRLSKGQYAMKRKETKSGRARHQGLDIEIIDSAAGRERPVSTLSGGELFLASLSLAFGLSDVVQSFAGGIHLDSLFIDEGFGSLDSETLDTAMDAITQVRENKLLGIISHVTELRERIPCGIEVIKTAAGSSLRMRG